MTTTTRLGRRLSGRGNLIITGPWDAFQEQIPHLPDVPTQEDLGRANGVELLCQVDAAGATERIRIGFLAAPKRVGTVMRSYAVPLAEAPATRSGRCRQCDRHHGLLVERTDGSGIAGWCCPTCAVLDGYELCFG